MNKVIKGICLLVAFYFLLITAGCKTITNVREHPTLETQLLDVDSVLVVTPVVTIEQENFSESNERIPEREEKIKQELVDFSKSILEERGFEVVEFDLDRAIAEDEQLAYSVTQARDGFDEAKKTMYEKQLGEKEKRNFKVSVGSAVNMVSEKSGADSILLIHYTGIKKSGGSIAKDLVIGVLVGLLTGQAPVAPMQVSYVEFAFIDGVSGEILWSNMHSAPSLNLQAAKQAMKAFPIDVDDTILISAQSPEASTNVAVQ